MSLSIDKYKQFAHNLISFNISVKKGEEVLIVIDSYTDKVPVECLCSEIENAGGICTVSKMHTFEEGDSSAKPSEVIVQSAIAADVIISFTRYNSCVLFDPRIGDLISNKKIRDVTLSCRDTKSFLKGGATADYAEVELIAKDLYDFWLDKKSFRVKNDLGTDVTGDLGEYPTLIAYGVARNSGESMAFSDGEISCTPNKGSVNGTIVVDGPIQSFGLAGSPVTLNVKNSKVIDVKSQDTEYVDRIKHMFETVPNSDYIAEFAIGVNPASLTNGDFAEEKKKLGNVHFAFGDNQYYGGDNACKVHLDIVLRNPVVTMNGIKTTENGKLCFTVK